MKARFEEELCGKVRETGGVWPGTKTYLLIWHATEISICIYYARADIFPCEKDFHDWHLHWSWVGWPMQLRSSLQAMGKPQGVMAAGDSEVLRLFANVFLLFGNDRVAVAAVHAGK